MTIIDQVVKSHLSTKGITENNLSSLKGSKQHYEYSLDGTPPLTGKPKPSTLDLGSPKSKYIDNLPK